MSSNDGVCEGVFGLLNGPPPTRNDPELDVGGACVDEACLCDALNASAMGESAACCWVEYGWAPMPVFERTGGLAGEEVEPETDEALA